jgi:Glycosyl transferase 4-like domain
MARFHLLSQYIWPDGAPTAIYAEQLAERLQSEGAEVVLAGGSGAYREADRPRPPIEVVPLPHGTGRRGSFGSVAREYLSVERAFRQYIRARVGRGDAVVVTSAPPNSIRLAGEIARRGARSVYWLQDYYPELLRSVIEPPALLRRLAASWFDAQLARWDKVVKIGGNLGYAGKNATVIRNWPTVVFGEDVAPAPKTALYSGNLGYGHLVPSFVELCEKLRGEGYRITVRGDGPGMAQLPGWIVQARPLRGLAELVRSYLESEVHLVAAHPRIQRAFFPSKLWNSLAARRRVLYSGFAGAMQDELEASLSSRYWEHLGQWVSLLTSLG